MTTNAIPTTSLLNNMTLTKLRSLAKTNGLVQKGRKAELIARLEAERTEQQTNDQQQARRKRYVEAKTTTNSNAMLIETDPSSFYRSHLLTQLGPAATIAMLMRTSVSRPNSHVHWFCTPQTARIFYKALLNQACNGDDMALRILAYIKGCTTVSFDTTIDHMAQHQPGCINDAAFDITWKKTWATDRWREDTGPRPARREVPLTNLTSRGFITDLPDEVVTAGVSREVQIVEPPKQHDTTTYQAMEATIIAEAQAAEELLAS